MRGRIDDVDDRIISLLSERSELSRKAFVIKKKNNMNIVDLDREKTASEARNNIARNKNLDPNFVKDVFTVIVMNLRRIQHEMDIKNN